MGLLPSVKIMQISSELASQTISKYVVGEALWRKGIDHNPHQLFIDAWATGVWTRQYGLISYKAIAEVLSLIAENKAEALAVEQRSSNLWLVDSAQGNGKYFVMRSGKYLSCSCPKFRCWQKRLGKECPQLLQALGGVFCHHTFAIQKQLK